MNAFINGFMGCAGILAFTLVLILLTFVGCGSFGHGITHP